MLISDDGCVFVDANVFAEYANRKGFSSVGVEDIEKLFRKLGYTQHVMTINGKTRCLWKIPPLAEARRGFEAMFGFRGPWPDKEAWQEEEE